uniref:Uncharacterized protein n=1 Tax=Rhizophora mucronata TaxID=61149 RepID=A0A2P2Q0C2_RHIMU
MGVTTGLTKKLFCLSLKQTLYWLIVVGPEFVCTHLSVILMAHGKISLFAIYVKLSVSDFKFLLGCNHCGTFKLWHHVLKFSPMLMQVWQLHMGMWRS